MSNVLEAISKLKLRNSKNHFSNLTSLILASLQLYRHMKLHSKQPVKQNLTKSGMRYLRGKSLSCDDFRGIAISPIISKIFEHCILDRFQTFFRTVVVILTLASKKGPGCRNAIYTVRNIVDNYFLKFDIKFMCNT